MGPHAQCVSTPFSSRPPGGLSQPLLAGYSGVALHTLPPPPLRTPPPPLFTFCRPDSSWCFQFIKTLILLGIADLHSISLFTSHFRIFVPSLFFRSKVLRNGLSRICDLTRPHPPSFFFLFPFCTFFPEDLDPTLPFSSSCIL